MASLFAANASRTTVRAKVLGQLEAVSLAAALQADAHDLYYSGWVSFLDALNGVRWGFSTWAITKLYYSVFYSLRASLAFDNVCAFHVSRPHYLVLAQPGQFPVSFTEPGTHRAVLRTFQRRNPGHVLVSQQIDMDTALNWLMSRRESANYNDSKFVEPDSRVELQLLADKGIRPMLAEYLADKTLLYVFDPAHAMVAYPLKALQLVGDQFRDNGGTGRLEMDEQRFLRTRARDERGCLTLLVSEMKRIGVVS